jgi:glucose/mannose-6-phosphate isomerase
MGATALAQVMSLVLFGDYVSFYLAILNRIDPTPVDSIDFVKNYLAQFTTVEL